MLAMNVTVIIPVFNEIHPVQELVSKVLATGLVTEIIIVDDGSTDGTQQVIQKMSGENSIKVILHDGNRGKGTAVRTGIDAASGDVVIIQDPGRDYHPGDYAALLQPFEKGKLDVVFGSRYQSGWHLPALNGNYFAIKWITFIANMLYNDILKDVVTGYKVFRPEVCNGITFNAMGFEFDPEFTAKILKKKIQILDIPIPLNPRSSSPEKKIRLSDSLMAVWTLVKYRFVN